MAKKTQLYFCSECGTETSKWSGQCPACKEWNTLVLAPTDSKGNAVKRNTFGAVSEVKSFSEVSLTAEDGMDSGISELNRVLGGSIVRGSLILVGGDPGIGKSTLLLQMCKHLSDMNRNVLYVSGEESLRQIKLRAERIGEFSDNLKLVSDTNLDDIREHVLNLKPDVLVIDSIQTMCLSGVESAAGSVSQVREVTQVLLRLSKEENIATFIIGHVTKEGTVAGPRMLEHMVDTVLYFEGDNSSSYRILRAVKNRFGSTNEIGVFEMYSGGLKEVLNPSEHMLEGMPEDEPGSVVTCIMEGTRPMLVEVQALVTKTAFNMPRRTAAGTDYNRVNLLLAVMEKHMKIHYSECDAYINVAGGMKVTTPSLDLPVIMALFSGYTGTPLPHKTIVFGEVGLTGEVRAVTQPLSRVLEAEKLGYEHCVLPYASLVSVKNSGTKTNIDLIGVKNIKDLRDIFKDVR
ncbi:MAG: DNA repair protein RadA [Lachnospiraceae bacterium]|nr:DNA repair protein RadA [Lachnospiraceae bacterium]